MTPGQVFPFLVTGWVLVGLYYATAWVRFELRCRADRRLVAARGRALGHRTDGNR